MPVLRSIREHSPLCLEAIFNGKIAIKRHRKVRKWHYLSWERTLFVARGLNRVMPCFTSVGNICMRTQGFCCQACDPMTQ